MTRVGAVGVPPALLRAGRTARGDGRFGASLDGAAQAGEAAEPREAVAAGGISAAAALLMLQEVPGELPDGPARNRRARDSAESALRGLSALQAALLGGTLDRAQLARLVDVAARAAEAEDPGLREAAGAIAVRAAVELARLEQARPDQLGG